MKWNHKKHTWDEIMTRLEELESFKLPFNLTSVLKSEGYGKDGNWSFVEYPSDEKAFFRFEISKPYCSIDLWCIDSGHWWDTSNKTIFLCIVDNSDKVWDKSNGKVFKTRKEACCYLLNRWEVYMEKEMWRKFYDNFRKRVDSLCNRK